MEKALANSHQVRAPRRHLPFRKNWPAALALCCAVLEEDFSLRIQGS